MNPVDTAYIEIWGEVVGAVAWDSNMEFGTFEFKPSFLTKGLDLAPLTMPLASAQRGQTKYDFRSLPKIT